MTCNYSLGPRFIDDIPIVTLQLMYHGNDNGPHNTDLVYVPCQQSIFATSIDCKIIFMG